MFPGWNRTPQAEQEMTKTKADTALLQEMEYNVIVCYEKQADWENAKSAMKQYQEDFPEDDSVSKRSRVPSGQDKKVTAVSSRAGCILADHDK